MPARKDDEARFLLAWQALTQKVGQAQITDFVARLPADRNQNLEHLVKAVSSGSGGEYDEFKTALISQMTAE